MRKRECFASARIFERRSSYFLAGIGGRVGRAAREPPYFRSWIPLRIVAAIPQAQCALRGPRHSWAGGSDPPRIRLDLQWPGAGVPRSLWPGSDKDERTHAGGRRRALIKQRVPEAVRDERWPPTPVSPDPAGRLQPMWVVAGDDVGSGGSERLRQAQLSFPRAGVPFGSPVH